MVNHTIVAFLACSGISLVSRGYAQHMPESLLRLKPGATLRVETTSLTRIDGRLLRATGDTLFLSAQGSEAVVPLSDLHALWQRGRATKTGAIVGGVVGAVGLTILFEALSGLSEEPSSSGSTVFWGVALGGAGGALVGGVIGAAIPRWHRRYP